MNFMWFFRAGFKHAVACFFAFCFSAEACVAVFSDRGLKRTPDKVIISWLERQSPGGFKTEVSEAVKTRIREGARSWGEKQGGLLLRLLNKRLKNTAKVVHVLLNHDWSIDYEIIKDNIEHYDEVAGPFRTNELLAISLDFDVSLALYADQYRSRKFAAASAVMEHINPFLHQKVLSPRSEDIFQTIYNKTHLVFWTPKDVHNLLDVAQKHLVQKEDLVALVENHPFHPHISQIHQKENNFYKESPDLLVFLFGSEATDQFFTNHKHTAFDVFMGFVEKHYKKQGLALPPLLVSKIQQHTQHWTYKEARGFLISINRRFSKHEVMDQMQNSDVLAKGYEEYKNNLSLAGKRGFSPSKKSKVVSSSRFFLKEGEALVPRLSPEEFQKAFPDLSFSRLAHLNSQDVRAFFRRHPVYPLSHIRKLSAKDKSLTDHFGPLPFFPARWVAFLKPSFLQDLKRSVALLADTLSFMTEAQKNILSRDQKRRIRQRLEMDNLWSEIRILDQIPHKKQGRKPLKSFNPPRTGGTGETSSAEKLCFSKDKAACLKESPALQQATDYADLMEAFLLREAAPLKAKAHASPSPLKARVQEIDVSVIPQLDRAIELLNVEDMSERQIQALSRDQVVFLSSRLKKSGQARSLSLRQYWEFFEENGWQDSSSLLERQDKNRVIADLFVEGLNVPSSELTALIVPFLDIKKLSLYKMHILKNQHLLSFFSVAQIQKMPQQLKNFILDFEEPPSSSIF